MRSQIRCLRVPTKNSSSTAVRSYAENPYLILPLSAAMRRRRILTLIGLNLCSSRSLVRRLEASTSLGGGQVLG